MSLISRKLLTADEVLSIENPYALVMVAGKSPAITRLPDISKTYFNTLNGMGTKEQNQKLRIERENIREIRPVQKIKVWEIWKKKSEEKLEEEQEIKKYKVELIQDKFKEKIKEINEKNIKNNFQSIAFSNAFIYCTYGQRNICNIIR